jgi:hypothetical protein
MCSNPRPTRRPGATSVSPYTNQSSSFSLARFPRALPRATSVSANHKNSIRIARHSATELAPRKRRAESSSPMPRSWRREAGRVRAGEKGEAGRGPSYAEAPTLLAWVNIPAKCCRARGRVAPHGYSRQLRRLKLRAPAFLAEPCEAFGSPLASAGPPLSVRPASETSSKGHARHFSGKKCTLAGPVSLKCKDFSRSCKI